MGVQQRLQDPFQPFDVVYCAREPYNQVWAQSELSRTCWCRLKCTIYSRLATMTNARPGLVSSWHLILT